MSSIGNDFSIVSIDLSSISSSGSNDIENMLSQLLSQVHEASNVPGVPVERRVNDYFLQNCHRKLSIESLPEVIRNEIKGNTSYELNLRSILFYRISTLLNEIKTSSRKEVENLYTSAVLTIPYYFDLFCKIKDKDEPLAINLKDSMLSMLGSLKESLGKLSMSNQIRAGTVIEILSCLIDSLAGEGLSIDSYKCLLWMIKDDEYQQNKPDQQFDELQKTAQDLSVNFQAFYSIFLGGEEAGESSQNSDMVLWKNSAKAVKKYVEKLKFKRKKTLTLDLMIELNRWSYEHFSPYKIYTVAFKALSALEQVKIASKTKKVDFNLFNLKPLMSSEEPFQESFFTSISLLNSVQILRAGLIHLQSHVLKTCESQVVQEDFKVNLIFLKKYLDRLKGVCNLTKNLNTSFEINKKIMTHDGCYSVPVYLKQAILNLTERLEKKIELHEAEYSNRPFISNLISFRFWMNYEQQVGVELLCKGVVEEIRTSMSHLEKINKGMLPQKGKERLRVLAQRKEKLDELKETLENTCKFIEFFDTEFTPLNKTLEDLSPFLQKNQALEPIKPIISHEKPPEIETPIQVTDALKTLPSSSSLNEILTPKNENVNGITKPATQKGKAPIEVDSFEQEDLFKKKLSNLESAVSSSNQSRQKGQHSSAHNVKLRDLLREVVNAGFEFVRQTGSHMQYKDKINPERGIVTLPRNSKKGTISVGVVKEVRERIQT